MLDHSQFHEEFGVEMPSPMQSYSRSESFVHNVITVATPPPLSSVACSGSGYGYGTRTATAHHSLKISIDDQSGKMKMAAKSLPSRNIRQDDKCCIAYTYLPFKQGHGFLEAFVVMDRQPGAAGMNDSTHRSLVSQVASTPDLRREGSVASVISIEGSKSSQVTGPSSGTIPTDETKASIDRSQHKQQQEYHLVITGYLPRSADSKQTKVDGGSDSQGKGKRGERKRSEVDYETNFYQIVPVMSRPSKIELCHLESESDSIFSNFSLFVASGTEVKMYILSPIRSLSHCNDDDRLHVTLATIHSHKEDQSSTTSTGSVQDDDFISLLLQNSKPLDQSPLLLPNPITAMNSFTQSNHRDRPYMNGLAIGCQDGSIRIITYLPKCPWKDVKLEDDAYSFELLNISECIIDGPIASLSFQSRKEDNTDRLGLFAGSICGFACSFAQRLQESATFEDPCAIVEGLWDARLEDEDSVLTICEFQCGTTQSGRVIALGLHSGRILLLTACNLDQSDIDIDDSMQPFESHPRYECVWHCTLPYPIHDIQASPNAMFPKMVVYTRRSLHLFRSSPESIAEAALKRIEQLIQKSQENDFKVDTHDEKEGGFEDTTSEILQ
jgi:hypothetical protein